MAKFQSIAHVWMGQKLRVKLGSESLLIGDLAQLVTGCHRLAFSISKFPSQFPFKELECHRMDLSLEEGIWLIFEEKLWENVDFYVSH